MAIPSDPAILLSYVNTQLRDNYPSLTEFCKANNLEENAIEVKLFTIGYVYDKKQNRFR